MIILKYLRLLGGVGLLMLVSCHNSGDTVMKLVEERDSLRQLSAQQDRYLSDFRHTVEILNGALDSISQEESMVFVNNGEQPLTKSDVKANLMRLEAVIHKQQGKIARLEERIASSDDTTRNHLRLIAHLKEQLLRKSLQVAELTDELAKSNVTLAELRQQLEAQRTRIDSQTATIEQLNQRTARQAEALSRQDAILNIGYIVIGTKSDLKRQGIVRKGSIVAAAMLDRSKFREIDIRKRTEISFEAKKPRVLTDMPVSSYQITTDGKHNFVLHILNPSDFWRISNYLVIQTD